MSPSGYTTLEDKYALYSTSRNITCIFLTVNARNFSNQQKSKICNALR